ncbi:hypothetical protein [Guptibacillus spartinae]|uniref:hypothetical protein n=1 Tax=Guptibacillus spartinae TaxID=3025679 RepID=UPI0023625D5B|nr:hypothetical protein [Pseudalkalibacillus spartinae]
MVLKIKYSKHQNDDDFKVIEKDEIALNDNPEKAAVDFFQQVDNTLEKVKANAEKIDDFVAHGMTAIEFFSNDRQYYYLFELQHNNETINSVQELGFCLEYTEYVTAENSYKINALTSVLKNKLNV